MTCTPLRRRPLALAFALLSIGAATAPTAIAQSNEPVKTYWYDGNVRREVWIDPQRNVVVPSRNDPSALPPSTPTPDKRRGQAPAARSLRPVDGAIAPPSAMQRRGGVVGTPAAADTTVGDGVIVKLREPLSDAQARLFLQGQGLTPRHEIGQGSGAWLVDSSAGLSAVELANRLHESGQFASAQPNWRRALGTK